MYEIMGVKKLLKPMKYHYFGGKVSKTTGSVLICCWHCPESPNTSIKPMEKFHVGLGMPKSDFFDWGCRKSYGWLQSAFKTNVKHTCDYVAGDLH